jgi:hypothetical protein
MQKEPENDEKKLKIITQLESLEKYPTEKNLAFIRQAKSAAQFTFFRSQFTRIMDSGVALVQQKNYTGAAEKFSEGFVLYRGDFDDKKYDKSITVPVLQSLEMIKTGVSQFGALQDACAAAYSAFMQAVASGNYEQSRQAFAHVQTAFAQYAAVRNSVARAGKVFQDTFSGLQKNDPELTEASFLAFAQRFTLGRASDSDSGIVGAMDARWNVMLEDMKPAVYNAVVAKLASLDGMLSPASLFASPALHENARALLAPARNFASLGNDVQNLYSLIEESDLQPRSARYTNYRDSMQFISEMTQRLADLLDDVQKISELDAEVNSRKNAYSDKRAGAEASYSSSQLSSVSSYETILQRAQTALSSSWYTDEATKEKLALSSKKAAQNQTVQTGTASGGEKNAKTTAGVQIDNSVLLWTEINAVYEMLCNQTALASSGSAGSVWGDLAQYYAKLGSDALAQFTISYAEANNQFNGVEEKDADTGTSLVKKYPNESALALDKLQSDIAAEITVLARNLRTLAGGSNYRSSSSTYAQGINTIESTVNALNELSLSGKLLAEKARAQVQLADRAKNEAQLRYNEAAQALAKERFDEARSDVQRARTKYNESLAYQESARLRKQSDTDLASLGAEIAKQENEVVVREVRTLKNNAKAAYYQGDFETAEKNLTQARTRWAVTNVDDDKEITNLLALVSTALSMKTGRVIPPTAPLYPEMSQILSIANQYYDQGLKLMNTGNTADANAVLNQAKGKLRTLQLVYPLNQEASLLTLRIDQLIDPVSFKSMFAQKIAAAKEDYKNPDKRQSAYTDLLDLYEINPSYPGLKQLINDVEIEIGVKQKPVDKTALTRSKTLTADAQKIYDSAGRDEVKLRSALSELDEAIRLNPNNDAAMLLKDRIQTSIGGQAAVVLSSADEAVYQQAIQELQKNNIVTANALVEQLLQKPANRRSSKILDLQKKVKALL